MPSYRVELHCHCSGDPVDTYLRHSVFESIDRARDVGINALAITLHKKIFDEEEAFAYARERGVLLIRGMEAEVNHRHVVMLNLALGDLPGSTSWAEIRKLRQTKPEVLVLAPHPFYPHPSCLGSSMNPNVDCLDAVEWCALHANWLPNWMSPNLRVTRWAERNHKPVVACSDAHSLKAIGRNTSLVEADELTPTAIMVGIRAGLVTFERRSLELGPLIYHVSKAIGSQPRHIARWARAKLTSRQA